jgi:transcriptional regulator with XRE-family HTH domain
VEKRVKSRGEKLAKNLTKAPIHVGKYHQNVPALWNYCAQLAYIYSPMTPGEVLRVLRSKRDWTLQKVADQLGVDRSGLTRKENGQQKVRRPDLLAWSSLFDVPIETIDAMIAGELDEPPPADAPPEPHTTPRLASAGHGVYAPPEHARFMGPTVTVNVTGESMTPALENGWTVLVRRCEWSSINSGDVVMIVWAQTEEATFFEAFMRPDGSIRLMKRNTRFAHAERELWPEQAMQLVASVYKVVGRGPS